MNGGTGLVYKDQETAEKVADRQRWHRAELLDKLEELNGTLDSLALHNLIEEERRALRP